MAATGSFWSCLAAPRPGGEEGREHPLAAVGYSPTPLQMGLGSEPPQRGEGRASSHPAICPPAPSPGACGCLLFQGTGRQCCLQARGVSAGAEHRSVHIWFPHAPKGSVTVSSWLGARYSASPPGILDHFK